MKEKELRRTLAVFPIGSVMKLTDLTARQIRYYEDQQLITPDRTEGNRRMFSLNDMDRLLEIKDYLSEGLNIAGIKNGLLRKKLNVKLPRLSVKRMSVRPFTVTFSSKVAFIQPHRHMVSYADHSFAKCYTHKETHMSITVEDIRREVKEKM